MPRRFRRFRKSGRRGRRTPWYAKKYSVGTLARKAWRGVWKLKGLVNSEMLHLDTAITGGIDTSGTMTHVTAIGQGDTVSGRTGNSVFVRALNWKGLLFRTSAGDYFQAFRMIVIQDTQQIGDTAPTLSDVLENVTVQSHLKVGTAGRFKILYNHVYHFDVNGVGGMPFQINLPMRHHIRYNGTASSDIQRGGLYCACLSTQGTGNYPQIQSEVRVSYHDN